MFKTRLKFSVVNFHYERAARYRKALAQTCEQLPYPIHEGMQFELMPNVHTTGLVSAKWEFEEKQFVGFGRAHVRGDDAVFEKLMADLRNEGYEVVECVETKYPCGHTGWLPLEPECEMCADARRARREGQQRALARRMNRKLISF